MRSSRRQLLYYLLCLVLIVGLGSVRSSPIYGKLDFLLLDGRPWWRAWQPMITKVLQQGTRPVLSDMMTSTVLRGVFAQKALLFRFDRRHSPADLEVFSKLNVPVCHLFPPGAVYLLMSSQEKTNGNMATMLRNDQQEGLIKIFADIAELDKTDRRKNKNNCPYRCIINLRGFSPSWVASETGHWPQWFAHTSLLYRYQGVGGDQLGPLLSKRPVENCMVFYDN